MADALTASLALSPIFGGSCADGNGRMLSVSLTAYSTGRVLFIVLACACTYFNPT
jgi:hypothetical protein